MWRKKKTFTIISTQEQEIAGLRNQIVSVKAGTFEDDENIAPLLLENTKLRHRLEILNNAIAKEKKLSPTAANVTEMISISNHLTELFADAIATAYPTLVNVPAVITQSNNIKFGDYQCNSALPIAKMTNNAEKPRDVAQKIVNNLGSSPIVEKVDIAGAGFINIYLEKWELPLQAIYVDLEN